MFPFVRLGVVRCLPLQHLVTKRYLSYGGKHVVTQQKFKESMAKVANQAMVLTAASPVGTSHELFHGLTISSMTSLALKPHPMIQFNLQLPSATSDTLHQNRYFAIHLLNPTNESIDIIRNFSKGALQGINRTMPFKDLEMNKHYMIHKIGNKTNYDLPILKEAQLAIICKKKNVFRVGDHEIWVGVVEDTIVMNDDTNGGVLYCNRNFHKLGSHI